MEWKPAAGQDVGCRQRAWNGGQRARRRGRPGGRSDGRRTGDRGVGARGSVRGAQARFDTRSRVGGPVATEPQWPRGKRVGGSLGTRHSAVTRKFAADAAPIKARPPASLPRFAASDTGGFAAVLALRQACVCHGACLDGVDHAFGTATCPQGSTGPAPGAGPPLATRVHGSLCRGGQGLWTLWTGGLEGCASAFVRGVADYYSVIIRNWEASLAWLQICVTRPLPARPARPAAFETPSERRLDLVDKARLPGKLTSVDRLAGQVGVCLANALADPGHVVAPTCRDGRQPR
jgi:hypothetical protein